MSRSQIAWMILWKHAAQDPTGREPFEIDEVVPEAAEALKMEEGDARRIVDNLLKELERLPDGRQYFAVEGGAVVPLPEFAALARDEATAIAAYPFET